MVKTPKFKELSFLVYGLGLSGLSVINFLKKKGNKNFKVWDDKKKYLFKNYKAHNLKKTCEDVDYIVLSPGISLIKNKFLKKFKKKLLQTLIYFI